MVNPHILIAMPCYRDALFAETAGSLLKLTIALQTHKVPFTFDLTGASDIVRVRNFHATRVLTQPSYSHLLFIDNDMSFSADAVFALLRSEKSFVGLMYPTRDMDFVKAIGIARGGLSQDSNVVISRASQFAYHPAPESKPETLMKVSGIGMGVTLIAREVLERIDAAGKLALHSSHIFTRRGVPGPLHGFFDHIDDASEDISFCKRWTTIGGEIFAITNHTVGHIGLHTYSARFSDIF